MKKNDISLEMLKDLNNEQKAAILNINTPVRVLAGAGSGKTKTLTKKIAYLIDVIGIDPKRIVALTFTNKAANEMKLRVESLINNAGSSMTISTFHSLCYKFLREEISCIKSYQSGTFSIITSVDQDSVLKEIYKKFEISKSTIPFPIVKEYISRNKYSSISPTRAKDMAKENNSDFDLVLAAIYEEYYRLLKVSKSLDFDDLLLYTKRILTKHDDIAEKWRNRFDYILIDEFQDTSKIQFDIIDIISNKKNITIVGDPDQTIYSWRGSDISFINNFNSLYDNVLTITLFRNYRSTKNILKAANNLIKYNTNRIQKNLETENDKGQKVEYYDGLTRDNEASWVISKINKLKKEKNQLKDIAILYRSSFYTRNIEHVLMKESIPYKIIGGQKFYERAEIKDALAYLRCLYEPTDISLKRIINVPQRKLGETTVAKLIAFAASKDLTLWDSWIKHFNDLKMPNEKKESLFTFINTLRKYNAFLKKKKPINEVLESLLKEVGFFEVLLKSEEQGEDRLESVRELLKSIKAWESKNENLSIGEYLDYISLETISTDDLSNISHVSLMTVHASKGLEFKNVFVIGLNEGIFPSQKSLNIDSEKGNNLMLEEERRLAYVAFTRAKEKLYLSSSKEHFMDFKNSSNTSLNPSRFLSEANIEISDIFKTGELSIDTRLKNENIEFETGDKIIHINFGEGVVLDINGDSLIIEFKDKEVGVKQLLKNHKSIEKIV